MNVPGYYISEDKSLLDISVIAQFLQGESYWAKNRSKKQIISSIQHSHCFGVFTDRHVQVGFARVVTDYNVFAWLMDVFIITDHRGKGLSKYLMTVIMQHPKLQGLHRWGLGTLDAHGLYEQFGFKALSHPERLMEIVTSL